MAPNQDQHFGDGPSDDGEDEKDNNSEEVNYDNSEEEIYDSSEDENDGKEPLWKYVECLDHLGRFGGNWQWKCSYCDSIYTGAYWRVRAHLLQLPGCGIEICPDVKRGDLGEMTQEEEEAELRATVPAGKPVAFPTSSDARSSDSFPDMPPPLKKRALDLGRRDVKVGCSVLLDALIARMFYSAGLPFSFAKNPDYIEAFTYATGNLISKWVPPEERAFNFVDEEEVRSKFARMFYYAGLSFNLARNPFYSMAFTIATSLPIPGYVPPSSKALMTDLLQEARADIDSMLESIKNTWKTKGVSIVSDGWSDLERKPIINFIAVTEGKPIFLSAVNPEGQTENKFYIADRLIEKIKEVGPQYVVQVITDNTEACREAGAIVEDCYPHIYWTPSVVHTLDLALNDICAAENTEGNRSTYEECRWITEVSKDVTLIKDFIIDHPMVLDMFNEHGMLKFLAVRETRFASVITMLKRFRNTKRCLRDLVLCEKWSLYGDHDVAKAHLMKDKVFEDLWWDKIDYVLSFSRPIYEMLQVADSNKQSLYLVCEMWDQMIAKVKNSIYQHEGKSDDDKSIFFDIVRGILSAQQRKNYTPLHYLAYSLNPRYYSPDWLGEGPNRVSPHEDHEISTGRNDCLKRYFPDPEQQRAVNIEFAKFCAAVDAFADTDSLRDRSLVDPGLWWALYGSSAPNLQSLASKIFGQPCSASCCEKNWDTYSIVRRIKKHKKISKQAEDLIFVHTNIRLLCRSSEKYLQGNTKMWDVGGDAHPFDLLSDTGLLEVANLFLDEPELEAELLFNEGEDVGSGHSCDHQADFNELRPN